MIGLGVIGAGRIGRIHAGNVVAHAGAKLVAVSDALPGAAESLAAELGTKATTREAMLADSSISGVLICSPTDTHADFIEEAVKAGKAVFCEKPVDLSSDRIRACLKTVAASGKPLMIGFNRRFDPNFAEAKKRLVAGAIGKIEMVTILSRDPGPPPAEYVKRSGGLFRDMMIHDLDMARFLLGEDPVEVHAVGSCLVDPAIGQAGDVDTAAVLLKTASGKIAQISNSRRASYGYDQRFEVHGEKGMVRAQNVPMTTVETANAEGFRADPVLPFFLERYAAAYRAELAAFLDCMTNGMEPSPSGVDGLKAQVLADAATESAQTGKPVHPVY
ncbi:MAG: inositol 2-dehydrogenase [Beijerinckiaceae bacterium]|nr:inositol 2-dehydrogenase [Beijerinckiaceae bacterium]